MLNAYETYRQTAVQTMTPERLILMLYEGGIKSLRLARDAYGRQEWIEGSRHIRKSQDIVAELISSLNMDAGEIAQNLAGLYIYMNRRLSHASINRDLAALDEVEGMVVELRETWEEILKKGAPKIQGTANMQGGVAIEG